jgi:hypothetical protein
VKVGFVLCGALAREVIAIAARHGWEVGLHGVAAKEHMLPIRIAPAVEARLRELIPRYERVIVVYGDCGTGGRLDEVLARYNVPRIAGPHCYEMYAGAAFAPLMEEQPGSFFLTDFLVRCFEGTVLKGLGLDRYPELRESYFGNYTRVVYLVQEQQPELLEKAARIAAGLGLPLEVRLGGYGQLELRLIELMATIHEQRYQPIHPSEVEEIDHGQLPDPLLARHPRAGARARRRRAGEPPAV